MCDATVRLRATPPALREMSITATPASSLKAWRHASRALAVMPPLSLTTRIPASSSRCSTTSRNETNCEKTIALADGSDSRMSCSSSISASIFVDDWNLRRSRRESRPAFARPAATTLPEAAAPSPAGPPSAAPLASPWVDVYAADAASDEMDAACRSTESGCSHVGQLHAASGSRASMYSRMHPRQNGWPQPESTTSSPSS
mmetsp:Transcript_25520/g.64870  ORF Transcript_25520/g.64870 Transcript_25520/m.64870 type:complete len:202 (+) Transcript_25520:687-1292(+)